MNRALIFPGLLSAALAVAPLIAAPKSKTATPVAPAIQSPTEPSTVPQAPSSKEPRLVQLQEDALLDSQAQAQTAQKIAKRKKALYDALAAEGFTKEEALWLLVPNQELSIPELNK